MNATQRLGLPLPFSGQAGKEATHNEALQALDTLVAAVVEEEATNAPPATPAVGACYLVGVSPTGDWAGKAGHLAAYTANGWRFNAPFEGLTTIIKTTGLAALFRGGSWEVGVVRAESVRVGGQQVVGSRSAAIGNPSGGAVIDSEARAAVGAILEALRAHGLIAS